MREEKEMKESKDHPQSKKEKDRRRGASDWNIWGPEEATQHQGALDWIIRGDASGQAHGDRTETSGEESAGLQQGYPDRNIRGAEGTDDRRHEAQEP